MSKPNSATCFMNDDTLSWSSHKATTHVKKAPENKSGKDRQVCLPSLFAKHAESEHVCENG